MRIYDVFNKAGRCGWYIAESPERACEIAFSHGRARFMENLSAVDRTEDLRSGNHPGFDEMLDGVEGIAFRELKTYTINEVMTQLRSPGRTTSPGRWGVHPLDAEPGVNVYYGSEIE